MLAFRCDPAMIEKNNHLPDFRATGHTQGLSVRCVALTLPCERKSAESIVCPLTEVRPTLPLWLQYLLQTILLQLGERTSDDLPLAVRSSGADAFDRKVVAPNRLIAERAHERPVPPRSLAAAADYAAP